VVKQVKEGKGDFVLIDARDSAAFQRAHIPGSISVPLAEVEQHAARLDREREYVTYCWNAT
jgi:rhodanese-related sulfurtransferase